jgi:hypothetical protein
MIRIPIANSDASFIKKKTTLPRASSSATLVNEITKPKLKKKKAKKKSTTNATQKMTLAAQKKHFEKEIETSQLALSKLTTKPTKKTIELPTVNVEYTVADEHDPTYLLQTQQLLQENLDGQSILFNKRSANEEHDSSKIQFISEEEDVYPCYCNILKVPPST